MQHEPLIQIFWKTALSAQQSEDFGGGVTVGRYGATVEAGVDSTRGEEWSTAWMLSCIRRMPKSSVAGAGLSCPFEDMRQLQFSQQHFIPVPGAMFMQQEQVSPAVRFVEHDDAPAVRRQPGKRKRELEYKRSTANRKIGRLIILPLRKDLERLRTF